MAVTGTSTRILKFGAQADAVTGRYHIAYVRWISKSANSGDDCVVQDAAGNNLFESVADGSNFIDMFPIFQWINGITVSTLDSGSVYVYLI